MDNNGTYISMSLSKRIEISDRDIVFDEVHDISFLLPIVPKVGEMISIQGTNHYEITSVRYWSMGLMPNGKTAAVRIVVEVKDR